MKAHAVGGRDKPKDVYDICYCLDSHPDAIAVVAKDWQSRRDNPLVVKALEILSEKFKTVDHYGPQQLPSFHDSADEDERAMYARRAFELVQKLLGLM
jgi:hypothetical protein